MQIQHTDRGFEYIDLPGGSRLQQSSVVGDYDDAFDRPGSSYIWYYGEHLNREQVSTMLESGPWKPECDIKSHILAWLKTGSFSLELKKDAMQTIIICARDGWTWRIEPQDLDEDPTNLGVDIVYKEHHGDEEIRTCIGTIDDATALAQAIMAYVNFVKNN